MTNKFLLFLSLLTFLACKHNIENSELGLYITDLGLSPEHALVMDDFNHKTNKEISFGHQLTIEIQNLSGFTKLPSGNVLAGVENSVIDEKNKVIFHVSDYFLKFGDKGVSMEDSKKIKINLTIGKPMERGKKYFMLFRIWDKKSGKEMKGNIELNVI